MDKNLRECISQLEIETAELTAIFHSIPDAVYIGRPEGITRANQTALDMLGFENLEELNQNIGKLADKIKTRDLITGKRLSVEEEPFYRAFLGESTVREVLTTHIKSGKEVIVRCSAAPVIHHDRIIGAIAINSDITENVKNRKELENAISTLARKNEELDKFVYTTSHDLKSPLNSIDSLLHLIQDENKDKLNEDGIQMLHMAIEKVNHMREFIHSLLESAATLCKSKEAVDLNKLVRKVINQLEVPDHIDIFIKHSLPTVVFHKTSLGQVFQNILSNAIKYSDKDKGLIKIDCQENDSAYIISINDNGMGIADTDMGKIFEKFKRVHEDDSKDSTGLGLSIVKNILNENNEKIWVESKVGEGSTFYFSLPKVSS